MQVLSNARSFILVAYGGLYFPNLLYPLALPASAMMM